MIWIVIILALVVGGVVGLFTRNFKKSFSAGLTVFVGGSLLSILIVLSGIMGG